jgi:hypothetical protein
MDVFFLLFHRKELTDSFTRNVRKHQYNETIMMHFLFNLLRIKGLYMFRALLSHPQEALHKRHLMHCQQNIKSVNMFDTTTCQTDYINCSKKVQHKIIGKA